MNFCRKNILSLKAISLLILFNITFSIFPVVQDPKKFLEKDLSVDKLSAEIHEQLRRKLDLLRVDQVCSSIKIFDDSQSIITENEWQELDLDKVLENWDKYKKTKFDIWGVKNLLRYAPEGSKELIRILVEDDKAFGILTEVLDKVESVQDQIISYWDETDSLNYDSQSMYYSVLSDRAPKINKFLNSNETILGVSHVFGLIGPFVNILALLGVSGAVNSYAVSKFAKVLGFDVKFEGWTNSFLRGLKAPFIAHNPFPSVYKNGFDHFRFFQSGSFTLGDKYVVGKSVVKFCVKNVIESEKAKSVLASAVSAVAVGGFQAWGDYQSYVSLRDSIAKINFLRKTADKIQENLVKVADMLRELNKLQDVCLKTGKENCFAIKNIENFLKRDGLSINLNKLLDNLDSPTFKNKTSTIYNSGRLLSTHRLMNEVKGQLIPLLQNIALIGGYRAIAQIVRAHKDSRTKFCFVDFIESKLPIIDMENAWIPLIIEEKVVANDIKFGLNFEADINCAARSAVVTGPNGGGKSTFMITVAFNVLLSKLGIAAADKACMTDFAKIRTSLRPAQDMASGLSSFMAEHKRVSEVKAAISSCPENILVLLDEPYKGTVEVESAIRVYEFGKYIAENCKNCVLLMATHLKRPIDLAQDTDGVFKNYQMGYIQHGDSDFERTFKIQDGPAIWWFDDAVKRSKFIDWLCANEICA